MGIISNYLLHKILNHKTDELKLYLPHYQIPDFKKIFLKILDVLKEFLVKISLFILPFSIVLTLLFSYPNQDDINKTYGAKL
jgi:Fe2+ transport system protein B